MQNEYRRYNTNVHTCKDTRTGRFWAYLSITCS